MKAKFTKLYTFKGKEDLHKDIEDVINDEESMSSFIRKAIYNEIIERKKLLKDDDDKPKPIKPIVFG